MPALVCKWVGHPGPTGRNNTWTTPALPGITIVHCGHPTALWPYYIDGHFDELGTFAKLDHAKAAATKFMKKPSRARPAEEVMADVQLQVPDLAEFMFMDREWIWYCGPALSGDNNKPKREALKTIGFRFAPGGHDMGDGETKGSWSHCCQVPMGPRRRKQAVPATKDAEQPDWAALGLT